MFPEYYCEENNNAALKICKKISTQSRNRENKKSFSLK